MKPLVLTYHSHNIAGNEYGNNDLVTLYHDLRTLHQFGKKIIPLQTLVAWLDGEVTDDRVDRSICLTFDDAPNLDFQDLSFPPHGQQRSGFNLLRDFQAEYGRNAQPELHATSFAIASPQARQQLDTTCLFAQHWLTDDWWHDAQHSGLWSIQNHSWDHNHPAVSPVAQKAQNKGDFSQIDTFAECQAQIVHSADYIAQKTGIRPTLFAYPYGQSSAYLRTVYFPDHAAEHGCRAAFGITPGAITRQSPRWDLPRFVCGLHWNTPEQFLELLSTHSRP